MEHRYVRHLRLIIKWLLLPIKLLAISTHNDEPSNNNQSSALRKTVGDCLPEITYNELTATMMIAETAAACAVCLSELEGDDRVRQLRNCNHVFHKKCLDTWLDHGEHATCPLCRAPLVAWPQTRSSPVAPAPEPSWAMERLLYLFGDDLAF